ncbi:phenylalanine--tRNA ligase subunit beta [candidate division WS5 bacterium]|uniref:Phenylalanine--tRNA ligase beta subunit n=1 Tax=candidate division WS5 bacterium TaxID=2093353 RepID=A0A419DCP4_9BACT|nr:MAG: phenylalanine--tRNA ligase subunit beta [candidate division WS5 bacterium]
MRIPISWLKEYVDVKVSAKELSDKLTMSGTENEILSSIGVDPGVVVGEVLEISPHPNADRLQVTRVNIGKEAITVVVGCPHNLEVGMKVPVVLAGTELPDGTRAEKVDLRGVISEGMFRSEMELGVSEHNSGIMTLEADAPVGESLASVLKKDKDILEAELTPNRGDCLSMIGIARETAVVTGQKLKLPKINVKEAKEKASDILLVEIKDKDLCSRYIGRVIKNVKVGPSPKWMQDRLNASGVRPINNVVDVTNYVMLEMGQPLHAFDLEKISNVSNSKLRKIIVRRAKKGEKIETLDGAMREPDSDDLVIADNEKAQAIAGIMGGAKSEISEETSTVILESANFNGTAIRKTALKLALRTEGSSRHEKGLPLQLTEEAADRAASLIAELSGGEVLAGKADVGEKNDKERKVFLNFERIKSFLGEDIPSGKAINILESLGFKVISKNKDRAEFVVPYWRLDVSIEEDLLEEIARIYGYENIPSTLPEGVLPSYEKNERIEVSKKLRDIFTALGFFEVYSYSFTNKEKAAIAKNTANLMKIANPLSQEQEYMRADLLGSMLDIIQKNKNYTPGKMKGIYEMCSIYTKEAETQKLSGMVLGTDAEEAFKYVKGLLDVLCKRLNLGTFTYKSHTKGGKKAIVEARGREAGHFVILDNEDMKRFKVKSKGACFFELDILILSELESQRSYKSIPKFPSSERDLTFVVEEMVTVGKIYETIDKVKPGIRAKTEVVDIYRGKGLPEGKKSISIHFVYQSDKRTLTDKEVDDDQKEIIKEVKKSLGGHVRGERE